MSEWARRRADELMESTVDANLALADHLRRLDRSHDAARAYKAAVDADPLREDIHRALMRAYAEAGERVKALKHYERLVGILHEELGIEPDEATQALHVAIRDQESMPA
jgi:DNA-binding SARP family transcriptional activator